MLLFLAEINTKSSPESEVKAFWDGNVQQPTLIMEN